MSKKKSKNEESIDKGKAKLNKYDPRGTQTLFRTLSRNHYNLLGMIDNKASIILTVNSIIISLLMAVVYMAPEEQKHILELGSRILLNCGMISMIFALLAMLPHKYSSLKSSDDYKGSLYGSNISKLSIEEYKEEMQRILNSGNTIYEEMTMDLYYIGKTISKKQRFIFISVGFFLFGLIGSVLLTFYHGVMIDSIFFGENI
jgi:hypothetical protein